MKFTNKHAKQFIKHMNLEMDTELFDITSLKNGMNVELEHGKIDTTTNVTNDDMIMTGKIALAHLREFPDYYDRLEILERKAKIYWQDRPKKRQKN